MLYSFCTTEQSELLKSQPVSKTNKQTKTKKNLSFTSDKITYLFCCYRGKLPCDQSENKEKTGFLFDFSLIHEEVSALRANHDSDDNEPSSALPSGNDSKVA